MERPIKEFSEKLYEILDDSRNSSIIRWNDDGQSFLLLDTIEFARSILELYFKHKNLNSFVRQLNKYDFHKIKSTPETLEKYGFHVWEFKHTYFQKNRRDLLGRIRRKRSVSERRSDYSNFDSDMAEKSILLQNQMLNSLKTLSKHFQMVSEDISELKRMILSERAVPEYTGSTALVYEESTNFKKMAVALLQSAGFAVYIAETGSEFSSFVTKRRFDLILVSMTLRNSFAAISEIRRVDINVIIVLTGVAISRNDYVEYHRLGVDEFLLKPYSEDMIVAILRKHDLAKKIHDAECSSLDVRNLKYL